MQSDMQGPSVSWVAREISDGLEKSDARSIARHLGGIVANDDRVVAAIEGALGSGPRDAARAVLEAVAEVLRG